MSGREDADAIKWSENKIEEEDSVKKVNCLRGRLLAERVASRNARDEAEQLGNKLLELEKLLKAEAKSRNRAEKKLKQMVKRLKSMNISYNNLPQFNYQESESIDNSDQNVQENDTLEDSSTSACEKTELVDGQRDLADHGVESSTLNQEDDQDPYNQIDNSMALIAVATPTRGENRRVDREVLDATVKEVLDALRRAKEQLLSSMERKRMNMIIKVG